MPVGVTRSKLIECSLINRLTAGAMIRFSPDSSWVSGQTVGEPGGALAVAVPAAAEARAESKSPLREKDEAEDNEEDDEEEERQSRQSWTPIGQGENWGS